MSRKIALFQPKAENAEVVKFFIGKIFSAKHPEQTTLIVPDVINVVNNKI